MATQSAPVKKKPLIFKHRAVPSKPVSATTTTTTTTTTAAVALDDSRDVSDDKTTPASVDLFRRSKKFFPKVFEEQSRRLAAEKFRHEPSTTTTAVSPPPLPEKQHDTKRRKVSYELPEDDDVAAVPSRPNTARSTTPPQSSPDKGKSKGKGKGIATRHSVNASVQFVEEIPDDDDNEDDVNNGDAEAAEREERLNLEQSKREEDIAFIKADEDADIGEIEEVKYIKTDGDHEKDPKGDKKDDNDDIMEAVDPEFEEYILRARARDAEIRAEQARKALEAQRSTKSHAGPTAALSQSSATTDEATATLPAPVTSTKGQSYRIFITPHFPQSVPPLIANVRMDQEMHVVQNAFLRHAASKGVDLDEDTEATVLMTWKGTKIYSWTTGELLRIKPDSRGRFRDDAHDHHHHHHHHHSHSSHNQPAAFMSGGLHLEIWTQELYDAYQHEQEKRRLRNLGEVVDDEDLDDDDDHKGRGGDFDSSGKEASQSQHAGHNSQAGAEKPKGIRLVLVSRSHEKLNMTVYPDTNVETMVQVFRQQRQIPENQQITIHFDGDQLDEDSTVADADMDDLDEVEVHIH